MNAPFTPGGRIDETKPFRPVRVAVLTISDTRDEESDTSGDLLASRVTGAGHELADRAIVPDDVARITTAIRASTAHSAGHSPADMARIIAARAGPAGKAGTRCQPDIFRWHGRRRIG